MKIIEYDFRITIESQIDIIDGKNIISEAFLIFNGEAICDLLKSEIIQSEFDCEKYVKLMIPKKIYDQLLCSAFEYENENIQLKILENKI